MIQLLIFEKNISYNLVNRPSLILDIEDIVDYYSTINPSLGIEFLERIEEAKKYILDFLFALQVKYKNVRTVLLEQFPYQIQYIIDDLEKQIVVNAIIHSYRNPKDFSKIKQ